MWIEKKKDTVHSSDLENWKAAIRELKSRHWKKMVRGTLGKDRKESKSYPVDGFIQRKIILLELYKNEHDAMIVPNSRVMTQYKIIHISFQE